MVYEQLRAMVVDGRVPAGARVSESHLASTLAVSRTPVREALARLEGDGLVRARGRGVEVLVLGEDELDDVLVARAELEAWTAGRAAELVKNGLVTPATLRDLDELADATDRLTTSGALGDAVVANRDLHLGIATLTGNQVVVRTLRLWWDHLLLATRHGLRNPDRVQDVAAEHAELLRAINVGDRDQAARAAREHVLTTRRVVRPGIDQGRAHGRS